MKGFTKLFKTNLFKYKFAMKRKRKVNSAHNVQLLHAPLVFPLVA